ncbi:hypothetical protein C5F50_11775 [Nitrosopumilus ureiphilus]|uniref:Uncharacterized protein n=2 Tax=Nitrosopumilus ureiphilus TaxID=1470067 RepID=A0A7D5M6H8_9ARCH|nr:hypothetical protein C5F50_11775 [Nitrosopumilus ureiphilus]
MDPTFTPDIYDEITTMIQYIPIINDEIQDGDIDTQFGIPLDEIEMAKKIGHNKDWISVRDIINLMIKLLQDERRTELIDLQQYAILMSGISYPPQYLLFDYCLAALDKDITDALLYLDHSYKILNLSSSFHIMLACITRNKFLDDKDVRKFLAILANTIQPISAPSHKDRYGQEYRNRFDTYDKELERK